MSFVVGSIFTVNMLLISFLDTKNHLATESHREYFFHRSAYEMQPVPMLKNISGYDKVEAGYKL